MCCYVRLLLTLLFGEQSMQHLRNMPDLAYTFSMANKQLDLTRMLSLTLLFLCDKLQGEGVTFLLFVFS